jgi:hypothetical protein
MSVLIHGCGEREFSALTGLKQDNSINCAKNTTPCKTIRCISILFEILKRVKRSVNIDPVRQINRVENNYEET